jgi:Cytochrome c554 and c-prime
MKVTDDQDRNAPQDPAGTPAEPGRVVDPRVAGVALATVALVAVSAAVLLARWLVPTQPAVAAPTGGQAKAELPPLFNNWPKPDLVLLLSGQQHGYILPCGCSRPQLGGLERRYNFLKELEAKGWTVATLDLGDVPQKQGPQTLPNVQGLIKYVKSMEALKMMNYTAVGFGEYEMGLPLREALDNYALNFPRPRVLGANLLNKETNFQDEVFDYAVEAPKGSKVKVGVIGVVGKSVAENAPKDKDVRFGAVADVLPGVIKKVNGGNPDVKVLLYQGTAEQAAACAKAIPEFDVILHLSETDTPPLTLKTVGKTLLVEVGHKGKHVGVVGVFLTGQAQQPVELRYQMVELGEEYKTPPEKEKDQPIVQLMEKYTKELRDSNYLAKYIQVNHPLQVEVKNVVPTYKGPTKNCRQCHQHAFEVWEKDKDSVTELSHAHAYRTLVEAKHPGNRQYDGECVVCHVTGFGYKSGFTNERDTPNLENVGCESCHGPASEHAKNPEDPKWRKLLNPWKAPENESAEAKEKRLLVIDQACQKCHDPDNDVNWNFKKKWPKIEHHTPEP